MVKSGHPIAYTGLGGIPTETDDAAAHKLVCDNGSPPTMDSNERHELIQRLGDAMSALQEACFYASWMCVTPTIVRLCRKAIHTGQPQGWGECDLTVACAAQMWRLAESLGGWAERGNDGTYVVGYPFTPLDSPGLDGEALA